jgi:hypothetical protein
MLLSPWAPRPPGWRRPIRFLPTVHRGPGPRPGRSGSHPSSLFRALSLSLPPSPNPSISSASAAASLSPFSRECAPTLHFAVTSAGQPPRLRDPLPYCSSPASCCSVCAPRVPPALEGLVRFELFHVIFVLHYVGVSVLCWVNTWQL